MQINHHHHDSRSDCGDGGIFLHLGSKVSDRYLKIRILDKIPVSYNSTIIFGAKCTK